MKPILRANFDERPETAAELSAVQRNQSLSDWNNTKAEYDRAACAHELIESAARRYPDGIAAVFEGQQLTYEDLNTRANRVAHQLRSAGVVPDALVGLYVRRSLNMVIGVVAILKAGGAYVPLDPSYPADRLNFLATDSRLAVLLTEANLAGEAPAVPRTICLDSDPGIIGNAGANPEKTATADHLAYVIYTSGSTGKPKGVAMTHRPLVNLMAWHQRTLPITVGSRVAQFAPMSFDVSFQEIFSTLVAGATLVIVPEGIRRDPRALLPFLESEAIQRLFLPFVMLQQLAQAAQLNRAFRSKLREIITAGEQLHVTPQLVQFFRRWPGCALHNHYGPTESHVVTSFTLTGNPDQWPALPPIGRPIANAECYVLDDNLNPVPIGAAGELYLGGECLARGYLNRPELTEERFVHNPNPEASGALLYKTGDLARYLPDGNLEYLGRIDHQVKLRGFRIELGEIEAVIRQVEGVQDAAVVVREDNQGDKRLVAYVVGAGQATCTTEQLRATLRQQLPDYMVPAATVFLDQFPLTPSGKVDRRGLPAPEISRDQMENSFVPCHSATERRVAEIWEQILSIKPIGRFDNFFDLGGDSLLGVRLMLEVEKTFAKSLPLAVLYEAPTVELLSKAIAEEGSELRQWSSLVPLQPHGSRPPFFWIHGETSDAFLPRYLGPDQPVYGLMHQSDDGRPARYITVEEIAGHYLNEIRSVRPEGPYVLGGYCFGGLVAFEIAQQLRKQGQSVPLLVLLAPDRPANVPGSGDCEAGVRHSQPVLTRWRAGVRRSVNTFRHLSSAQKVRYALAGVSGRIRAHAINPIAYPAATLAKRVACRLWLGLGRRLPIGLRSFYILDIYRAAAQSYVPEVYDGRMIVFDPVEDHIDVEVWRRLSGGMIEIQHTIGNHTEVLRNQDQVKIWAKALNAQLQTVSEPKPTNDSTPERLVFCG